LIEIRLSKQLSSGQYAEVSRDMWFTSLRHILLSDTQLAWRPWLGNLLEKPRFLSFWRPKSLKRFNFRFWGFLCSL